MDANGAAAKAIKDGVGTSKSGDKGFASGTGTSVGIGGDSGNAKDGAVNSQSGKDSVSGSGSGTSTPGSVVQGNQILDLSKGMPATTGTASSTGTTGGTPNHLNASGSQVPGMNGGEGSPFLNPNAGGGGFGSGNAGSGTGTGGGAGRGLSGDGSEQGFGAAGRANGNRGGLDATQKEMAEEERIREKMNRKISNQKPAENPVTGKEAWKTLWLGRAALIGTGLFLPFFFWRRKKKKS